MHSISNEIPVRSKDQRKTPKFRQFSTFSVGNRLYGIEVTRVQEVVRDMPITPIPLAPHYVRGLINLRGQIATAIGLRDLFGINPTCPGPIMNVICRIESVLVALQVDEIGDVIEVQSKDFEDTPHTVPVGVRRFMEGIYKMPDSLLSVLDVDEINLFLNNNHE